MLSVAVLLLNDHLLKHAWPGLVTGKLSDVAGLVVAPPLLALLLCRRADLAATILTGALFTLVKSTEMGAEAASHAWTALAGPSRVVADYTDLLALPALGLAWWIRQRSLRPDPRRLRVIATVPLAVLAVTATSAHPGHPTAETVEVHRGSIVVTGRFGPDLVSDDGGQTWTTGSVLPASRERGPEQRAACVPKDPERCYSIVDGLMRVMQSDDGGKTWTVSWEVPPAGVETLESTLAAARSYGPIRSNSLAVQPRAGGGHVVVVANGRDGVAVRDVAGTWRRLGFGDGDLLSESGAVPLDRPLDAGGAMWIAALAALWTVLAGLAVQAVRRPRRARPALIVVQGGVGAVMLAPWPAHQLEGLFWLTGAALLVTAVIVATSLVPDARIGSRGVVNALAAGVLVGLGLAVPFRAWSEGWIDYGASLALGLTLGLGTAIGGLVALRRSARLRVEDVRTPPHT
ncbi:sialidase family protein [Nonomuraea sp. LPB2021202275-12-8]|uniref:sialidase family protein n=1 Tax=Nonomuraea sp. LPB2021202275-12-8 TaxID=3120159 RepID=UPI00300DB303